MLRLTRTAIGLLTAQYRSVLKKCWAINVGVFGLMGKVAASVAKGAADTIGGTLNGYGINVIAYMLGLLDSLLNIKSNAFDEQSAKATATELPFDAPTVAGTLSAFGANVMDSILLNLQSKKFVTLKALPVAVVAATVMATTLTVMPSEAEALQWCISTSASSTPLRLVGNTSSCPSGYTDFGEQSGSNAVALGYLSDASGGSSTAVGYYSNAGGQSSVSIGDESKVTQNYGIAIGYLAEARGYASTALGPDAYASGWGSASLGFFSKSKGYASTALGYNDIATADWSTALGSASHAAKAYTTAVGYQAVANVDVATDTNGNVTQGIISVGHKNGDPKGYKDENYTSDLFSRIINVAEGSDANDAVTVSQLGSIAAGTKILNATGTSAISFGTGTGQTTVGTAIATVANELVNNYYEKV